jgi:hypothetical protein
MQPNILLTFLYVELIFLYFCAWYFLGYYLYTRFIGPYFWYKKIIKEYKIKLPPVEILQHFYFILPNLNISGAYFPTTDQIHTKYIGYYDTPFHYLYTVFHELAHYTGIETRLNRNQIGVSVGEYNKAIKTADIALLKKHLTEEFIAETTAKYLVIYYDLPLDINSLRKFRHRYYDLIPYKISFSMQEYRAMINESIKATKIILKLGGNKYKVSYIWP